MLYGVTEIVILSGIRGTVHSQGNLGGIAIPGTLLGMPFVHLFQPLSPSSLQSFDDSNRVGGGQVSMVPSLRSTQCGAEGGRGASPKASRQEVEGAESPRQGVVMGTGESQADARSLARATREGKRLPAARRDLAEISSALARICFPSAKWDLGVIPGRDSIRALV